MKIYLNNAATSWPKPEAVSSAMSEFLISGGANLARGSAAARDMGTLDMVTTARQVVARFFGGFSNADPRYVTFTSNITESLNLVLKGFLGPGDHVVTTSMEHNAVMRPLRRLEDSGTLVTVLNTQTDGILSPALLADTLSCKTTKLVVLSHASNVCGSIQLLAQIAEICRQANVPLVVDAAQTAGVIPVSISEMDIAAFCFTGHKGLLGPQGIGGIVWKPEFAEKAPPFVEGGTGSFSHLERQPSSLPDKFEAGTPNLPGIAGLLAALQWLENKGLDQIAEKERVLGEKLLEGLLSIRELELYGKTTMDDRLAVFPVNPPDGDNGTLSFRLASDWGVETRPGLHCAPGAHRTLGSFPQGALRISVGSFNTEEDIDRCLEGLRTLMRSAT
ncbi:MAG: aminotransferase class V-fold PLP-dependent enzyme [Synergistota bacterium]|nr:aminotransferase class V-fold PLP-dependent enzyme [Synergistota bacterium]